MGGRICFELIIRRRSRLYMYERSITSESVMINFYSIMMDPQAWKDPEMFRPERFLEEEKALAGAFFDAEMKPTPESYKFCPFGIGKRMCVGFGIGRIIMFLKVVTHVHCFSWEPGPDGMPDYETEHFGVTLVSNETRLKITPRPPAKLAKSIEGKESRVYRSF